MFEGADLSSLDVIGYGGSPMPEALIVELMERLPHVRFGQAYGMTELSPACTYLEPRHHTLDPAKRHWLSSGGRPAVGVDIRIVDAQDRELPTGEIGEITVAGPIVMQGYWRQPELTREVLRGGYMHTGDIGRMDEDGFLYVLDRLKDMIVTGGENVYSVEVEFGDPPASRRGDCRGRRRSLSRLGRGRPRRGRAAGRRSARRRDDHSALPPPSRRLQGAALGRVP